MLFKQEWTSSSWVKSVTVVVYRTHFHNGNSGSHIGEDVWERTRVAHILLIIVVCSAAVSVVGDLQFCFSKENSLKHILRCGRTKNDLGGLRIEN